MHVETIPSTSFNCTTVTGPQTVATQSTPGASPSFPLEAAEGIAVKSVQLLSPFKNLPCPTPLPVPNFLDILNASHNSETPESVRESFISVTNLPNPTIHLAPDFSSSAYEVPQIQSSRITSSFPEKLDSISNTGDDNLESSIHSLVSLPIALSMSEDYGTSSDTPLLINLLEANRSIKTTQEFDVANASRRQNMTTQPTPFSHVPSASDVPKSSIKIMASPESTTATKLQILEDRKIDVVSEVNAVGESSGKSRNKVELAVPKKFTIWANNSNSQSDKGVPCQASPPRHSSHRGQENSKDPIVSNQKLTQLSDAEWKQLRVLMARPRVNLEKIPAKWESEIRERGCVTLNMSTRRTNRGRKKKYCWFS